MLQDLSKPQLKKLLIRTLLGDCVLLTPGKPTKRRIESSKTLLTKLFEAARAKGMHDYITESDGELVPSDKLLEQCHKHLEHYNKHIVEEVITDLSIIDFDHELLQEGEAGYKKKK